MHFQSCLKLLHVTRVVCITLHFQPGRLLKRFSTFFSDDGLCARSKSGGRAGKSGLRRLCPKSSDWSDLGTIEEFLTEIRGGSDMIFVQHFTLPDFQATHNDFLETTIWITLIVCVTPTNSTHSDTHLRRHTSHSLALVDSKGIHTHTNSTHTHRNPHCRRRHASRSLASAIWDKLSFCGTQRANPGKFSAVVAYEGGGYDYNIWSVECLHVDSPSCS